ncbi:MAG: YesL family protein [Oscillospiraceae bacterium]|nr:YesL family protein [Oscillospiraceae bacterium]
MSLFYTPEKSGKGVSKEEAQREIKPFFKFWSLLGRKFWYLIQLNCLYLLLCIPIVTFGPATVALTRVVRRFVIEQPIFVFSEFFGAFKKSFNIRTVFLGITSLVFFISFLFSLFYSFYIVNAEPNGVNYFTLAMTMASGAVLLIVNAYIYTQIACLDLKMSAMLKNAGILCIAGFKRNIVILFGFVATILITSVIILSWPFLIILLLLAPFAQLAFFSVFNVYPVIQRYIVNPFYESLGERNPETQDYSGATSDESDERGGKTALFTDLGGQEMPIDRKKVKSSGKLIK